MINFEKGRFADFIIGVLNIIFGLWVRSFEVIYSRGFSVPKVTWIFFVILGTVWSIHAVKNRNKPKIR